MNLKIKPTVMSAPTKGELLSKIHRLTGKSGYTYPTKTSTNEVILYNLEKHGKKTKVNKRKKKIASEHGVSFQRDVVRQKHWKAYVYVIPQALVKTYKQNNRTFTVEFKQ